MSIGHRFKMCHNKEKKLIFWKHLFDFSDTSRTGVIQVADPTTRLLVEVSMLHRSQLTIVHECLNYKHIIIQMYLLLIILCTKIDLRIIHSRTKLVKTKDTFRHVFVILIH